MGSRGNGVILGLGCLLLVIVMVMGLGLVAFGALYIPRQVERQVQAALTERPVVTRVVEVAAEPTARALPSTGRAGAAAPSAGSSSAVPAIESEDLTALYQQLTPGVVNIQVVVQRMGTSGEGAGSGFILDDAGHIVTNNHVVAGATKVVVVFFDGTEVEAKVVGTDADSDLAVVRVERLPEGTHPLPLGDSSQVQAGEWVVAIGNPFNLGGSMTVGIISAVGRTISSGVTPFSIPEVLQTDAAINPGNSGGPLLNLRGEVIGVNAQIATSGVRANAGVGFAIPVNVVRIVAPALIERGAYSWPWLGVQGSSVNLMLQQANDLPSQEGAYIAGVVRNGPAAAAGMQGSTGTTTIDGIEVPTGGDVVTAVDGRPIRDFADLLAEIAFRQPGQTVSLTVLRGNRTVQVDVTLAPRPQNVQ
ncbi:MAG: PDZ domain-containing protein [Chloroflexi bacterium]|nr:PDZ domain-containing protein [Chloroflexota bacterium]